MLPEQQDFIIEQLGHLDLTDDQLYLIAAFVADLLPEQFEALRALLEEDNSWLNYLIENLTQKREAIRGNNQALWNSIAEKEDLSLSRLQIKDA